VRGEPLPPGVILAFSTMIMAAPLFAMRL